ncbi:hypothetical protein [Mycoplasma phocimorsus]|uniref:hypothetical protein n=1 Tax=Mycoplasma phocimorsus TaxID=3045839 RepID=UPI0024C050FD|nr:hypothetical protein [Mycoplasma phocimorsus]MDJ1646651.1 hypothetical protein [Mycoplasma phocimorsus]
MKLKNVLSGINGTIGLMAILLISASVNNSSVEKEELITDKKKQQLKKDINKKNHNFFFKENNDITNKLMSPLSALKSIPTPILSSPKIPSAQSIIWNALKDWWKNWISPIFYGLIGVSSSIGLGYVLYTEYWKNKRNFKLEDKQNLKITLELYPKDDKNKNNWYGLFYNNNSTLYTECSCQRRFKNGSNTFLSVSYILRNGPNNPGLILYKEDKTDSKKTEVETPWFPIIDYYPGANKVPFYKYGSKNEKLGDLVIKREIINDDKLCDTYKKMINETDYKCEFSCCVAIEKKKCDKQQCTSNSANCICKNNMSK